MTNVRFKILNFLRSSLCVVIYYIYHCNNINNSAEYRVLEKKYCLKKIKNNNVTLFDKKFTVSLRFLYFIQNQTFLNI